MRRLPPWLALLSLLLHIVSTHARPPVDYPQLIGFIKSGETALLKESLLGRTRQDINLAGRTVLMASAITAAQPDAIDALIDWGMDANRSLPLQQDGQPHDITPLIFAISSKASLAVVERLIARGADAGKPSGDILPLGFAIVLRQYEIANLLLDHGSSAAAADRIVGMTPLMELAVAAQEGDDLVTMALLNRLVAGGADVNARARRGSTALSLAVLGGKATLVRALLDLGADPNTRNDRGGVADGLRPAPAAERPDRVAASVGSALVTLCRRSGAALMAIAMTVAISSQAQPIDPLLRALSHALAFDDPRALSRLLTAKNIRRLAPADRMALMVELIDRHNVPGLSAAIRAGLDPDRPLVMDREGEPVTVTPLNFALAASTDPAVALRLIELGADVDLFSIDDMPPMLTAATLHADEVLGRLLARGADPNVAESIGGLTPLMLVVARKTHHAEALARAQELVRHGATVDATSFAGYTPLMLAARCGNTQAVQWLRQLGADTTRVADNGDTFESLSASQPSADDIASAERAQALDNVPSRKPRP